MQNEITSAEAHSIPEISVLIPVLNEQDILESSVRRVHEHLLNLGITHEVLVGSNGSTDATVEIGERLARENAWFKFFHTAERGPGHAFKKMVSEATSNNLVCLDVDLSFDMSFLEVAADLLKHAHMVVGSKTMGKQRRSLLRVLASQAYIMCAQLMFDLTISDYSIGCKAYQRDAILKFLPLLDNWTGYTFELCLLLTRSNKKVLQVGIDCDDRRSSKFSLLYEGYHRYLHLWRCARRGEELLGGRSKQGG